MNQNSNSLIIYEDFLPDQEPDKFIQSQYDKLNTFSSSINRYFICIINLAQWN